MAIAATAALVGAVGSALVLSATGSVQLSDRAAIEKIVRDYILANPEILPEAMENLRAKELGKVVAANRAAIETPIGDA